LFGRVFRTISFGTPRPSLLPPLARPPRSPFLLLLPLLFKNKLLTPRISTFSKLLLPLPPTGKVVPLPVAVPVAEPALVMLLVSRDWTFSATTSSSNSSAALCKSRRKCLSQSCSRLDRETHSLRP